MAEWKLNDKETLDFLTKFSESRSDRSVTYMYELLRAFQSLTQHKLLEYLLETERGNIGLHHKLIDMLQQIPEVTQ